MTGFLKFLVALFVLAIVVGSIWAHFAAPCGYFKYMPAKDIPGRCLMVNN